MDAIALARSFPGTIVGAKSSFSKKLILPAQFSRVAIGKKQSILPCLKAGDTSSVLTSDVSAYEKTEDVQKATFPAGVEGMLREICDGTTVAEVKLKVGNFQMYVKREVESSSVESHPPPHSVAIAPPVSSASLSESSQIEAIQKYSEERNPFENTSGNEAKLARIQDNDASSFEIVSAPTVGVFLRSRTRKGQQLPPACKESNVAGEVITFLCKDGEPVGYGDPLLAVLPSFHGNEIGL
ncbi:hypothetical protein FCM35_KLT12794 [Carex littledalei]|uniref:Biotin carboxyl carrier protein n=1 Tax=Carex littledalei TaxID=544730 RepID=A0A833QEV3_9POAL|nr:hypothetical protein FCM35_KLT12794 [Carex littledalei]